jgi:DNA polymerase I-like protein with 3'-5' exonuclease and polymerase domains
MYEITDLRSLVVDTTKPIFVDTETGGSVTTTKEIMGRVVTSKKEYTDIVTIQCYQEHWDKVKVFVISELPSDAVATIWSKISQTTMVGHNYGFDLGMFSKYTELGSYSWEDTFYAARLAKPSWQEYSLDKCLTKVLGYDPYDREGLVKKDMQKSFSPDSYPTHSQLVYASVDVLLLPKLYHEVVPSVTSTFNYKLDKRIAEIALGMLNHGMPVDVEKLFELEKEFKKNIEHADKVLGDLNVNSYRQVREALGLEYSSDEVALKIIIGRENGLTGYTVFKHPKLPGSNVPLEPNYVHSEYKIELATAIIEKRKNLKLVNFVKRALENMNDQHRITARFSPHAISGRVQPSDENLSQYPRAMKAMWGINPAIHGDRVLIYADYSQLELRTICAILPERNMEKAYRNKIDLHTFAAGNLDIDESKLPKSVTKRSIAKSCIAKGSKVAIPGGYKNIEDIKPNDRVFSLDEDRKATVTTVKAVKYMGDKPTIRLKWRSRNGHKQGELICTPDHLVMLRDGSYIEAKDCKYCTLATGQTILDIEEVGVLPVYDIEVDKHHNFIVNEVCVHNCNFLYLYGGGVANFQKVVCKNSGVFLDMDICKKSAKDWKDGFSDIKKWHEKNANSKGHQGTTIGGRRYKAKNFTDLNNIQVQGSGAEVAKLAWNYLHKFGVVGGDVYEVNFVHDAFVVEAPADPEIYKRVAEGLGKCMKLSWQEVMRNAPIPDLPMPVDVLVGRNWADLEYETDVMYSVTIDGEYDSNLMEEMKQW